MYNSFSKVRTSFLAKVLGVLVILAVVFPASAVAPLAFAEGEETAAPAVEVLPASDAPVVDVVPQQSLDVVLVEDTTKETTTDQEIGTEEVPSDTSVTPEVIGVAAEETEIPQGEVLGALASDTQTVVVKEQPLVCDAEVELIPNGSFEAPVVTHSSGWDIFNSGDFSLAWLADWINPTGAPDPASIELQKNGIVSGWSASNGTQWAELDGDWNGHNEGPEGEAASTYIYVDVPTIVGENYTLSYDFSPRPDTADTQNVLGVEWDGASIATQGPIAGAVGATSWTSYAHPNLAPTGAITRIGFKDLGTADSLGTLLDNVSLRCIPKEEKDATITVHKVVVGSDVSPEDFNLFVDGYSVTNGVPTEFDPGTFFIHEEYTPYFVPTFSGACVEDEGKQAKLDSIYDFTAKKNALQASIDEDPNDPGVPAKIDAIHDIEAKINAIYLSITASVHIEEGDHVECTITNTYVPPVQVAAYCGDGIVNQEWEQCDGSEGCTAQCQSDSLCTEKAFARVVVNNASNTKSGNVSSDIFLGGNAMTDKIPSGTWFMIHDSANYITDPVLTPATYMDVPGLAVQRLAGQVYVGIWGDHEVDRAKEHVDGYVEFFNVNPASVSQANNANPPRLEQPFNGTGFGGTNNANDELRIVTPGKSEFSMTTTTNGDSFYTNYTELTGQCTTITVKKHVVNDGQGVKAASDFTMHLSGTVVGSTQDFAGSETGTIFNVNPGTYSVSESAPFGGYTGSMSADCSGTIALGENKVCTVTNDDTHYTAFCGDNIVNQGWEQCDGGANCTAQCQTSNVCTDKAFARVNVTNITDTTVVHDLTSDIFVGGTNGDAMIMPQGTWFLIFDGVNYPYDDRTNGSQYFNVPGIAVQRLTGGLNKLWTGVYGQDNFDNTKIKHAEGTVEFFNTAATMITEGPGSMHMESGFNGTGFGGFTHTDDEARLNAGVAEFSLTTSSVGDAFGTVFSTPQSCEDDGGTDGGTTGQGGTTGDDGDGTTTGSTTGAGSTGGSTDGGSTGSGSTTGGSGSGSSGGSGGGGGTGVPIIPTGSVLGAKTSDVGGGDGDAQGQVLGESLAQTGIPLSFPMLLSIILAIATIIVTRKEKFI
jgi:hypothetical protein